MMFQLPPLKVNLPKPKIKKTEVRTECGQRVWCEKRDTYLDMSQMSLKLLPKAIARCDCLISLVLSRNYLRELPKEIISLDSLETLDLSCNKFTDIPQVIFNLTSLIELDLSSNVISEVPLDIRYLKYLKILRLNNNRIRRLPNNMQHLTCLIYLNASFNRLTEYPSSLCQAWPLIKQLNLSYNSITKLPYDIVKLSDFMEKPNTLDLRKNPLTYPPIEVCIKGLEAMRDYIEPLWRGMQEFKNRKILDKVRSEQAMGYKPNPWNDPVEEVKEESPPPAATTTIKEKTKPPPKPKPPSKTIDVATKKRTKTAQISRHDTSTKIIKKKSKGSKSSRISYSSPTLDLEDSSQVTLVEVYGDSNSLDLLSPLPDSRTPACDKIEFTDDEESDLLDLINETFEPPDLDIPDSLLGNFGRDAGGGGSGGGGGMLEQWLGTVQSLTMSPTTRGGSRDSMTLEGVDGLESSGENMIYTPFSDVKITRSVPADSSSVSGSTKIDEPEDNKSEDEPEGRSSMKEMLDDLDRDVKETRRSYDDLSCSDLERLSVIFSDDADNPHTMTQKSDGAATEGCGTEVCSKGEETDKSQRTKPKALKKKQSVSSMRSRKSSTASFSDRLNITSNNSPPKKKKKLKKRRKKGKAQLSEMEMYSRIPFRPLLISPRTVPCSRGLRTWYYFREPESCYLLNNYTIEETDKRTVTFGTDEVTVISSPSLHSIAVFSEAESLEANNSSSSLCESRQTFFTDNSQQLSNSTRANTADLLTENSDQVSNRGYQSTFDDSLLSTGNMTKRPASLPAPLHHTWTNDDLAKYIYKPSSLIVPPNVLITYFGEGNVHENHVVKLVNTLELFGFAECHCDLVLKEEDNLYNFEKDGYVAWLDEKARECEFIIVILSKKYIQSLPFITRLDSYTPPRHRPSPYVSNADAKRWGITPQEIQKKFVAVYNDDCDHMAIPPWLNSTPFFVPSELCELGYHLISRDSRDSIVIPNIFGDPEYKEDTFSDSESTSSGNEKLDEGREEHVNIYRVTPVTAHLTVNPADIPPDWRLEEMGGKIRHHWKNFARTCGFDAIVVTEIDTVYSGMLAKSVQCLKTWKQELVGGATYEELARRLDQVGLRYIADAYCTFGTLSPNLKLR